MREVGIAVATAVVLAVLVGIWNVTTNGGLITALGGATAEQLETVEKRIVDLSDVEFYVESRSLAQADARAGRNTILDALVCDAGWYNGPAFHDSYQASRPGGTSLEAHQQYLRLCFRQRQ